MCRFLVYKGREMPMSDVLINADRSLINQSFHAREREEPLNGDGFGVGWYQPQIDPIPCVFTSTSPAWSNRNLHRMAGKIYSGLFFAHVRAATEGLYVSEANCHPFQHEEFLWMHNGGIAGFARIKRRLRQSLSDTAYGLIQGTTDSEHAFALFLDILADRIEDYTATDLRDAMVETIRRLEKMSRAAGITDPSRYNFALTDGHSVVATRYTTDPTSLPHTLYVAKGQRFESVDGQYRMLSTERHPNAVIIASEPLTEDRSDWETVPENHSVVITPEMRVHISPIE
jgi:glutamine amidotransferase